VSQESKKPRVAFQGEAGAFSEAAAVQLLGEHIVTIPRPTFEATFRAIADDAADALLVPVENSLAGSVVRVYDLLLESALGIVAETILPIALHLIGCPGASLTDIRTVYSHPMALAQCERFFSKHPSLKRTPAEDTAGSVREVLARGDRAHAAIAGRRAAVRYHGVILADSIQDNAENFTRFVLLEPAKEGLNRAAAGAQKMSIAMRLAHRPGSLLSALEPFARHGVNLLKIESRPIHGRPWEYQFFIDVEAEEVTRLKAAVEALHQSAHEIRILGLYSAARTNATGSAASTYRK
jgi:prephenate dehydratase